MRLKQSYLILIYFIASFPLTAQYYDTGEDPASLKWLRIKTERFSVIFPENYGAGGEEFARALEKASSDLSVLFPEKKFRIPVIIHNHTTQSNGYVAWAPKRMEVFPTPEQNSIPLDPNTQLAIHEMTHVLQMEALNSGFSKAASYLLGQQFPGAMASLLPLWYMEGEAVLAETAFTASGRGRSASFQKQLKALAVEKGSLYKYDKILNGSYRNFIPDHYQTGYQMVAWSMARYDPKVWNKVLKLTANMPYTLNPVNISLSKNTGLTKRRLYNESFDTLTKIWANEISVNGSKGYEVISPAKRKDYINYFSPAKAGENRFVAVKTSLFRPPEFVIINPSDRTEERLHVPGSFYPYSISSANGLLAWVENQPDPRWNNRNYSVIKLMSLKDRRVKQITSKTRYMSVSLSPDGKLIAATENNIDNTNRLAVINSETGSVVQSIPVPYNAYLQKPKWSDDGKFIIFISLTKNGEGIIAYKFPDNTWETLITERPEDFQEAIMRNDSLFYVSSVSGTENIYVLSPGRNLTMITNSRFGATDFFLEGSQIFFSDYSSTGNNICYSNLKDIRQSGRQDITSAFRLIDEVELRGTEENAGSQGKYVAVPYRKWQHLFGFHSWMPFYADIEAVKDDPFSIRPGFTALSQNHLSSLITSLGYEHSDNEHKFHSRITWKGWYPVFESRIDYGGLPGINKMREEVSNPSSISQGVSFSNKISVPLNFSTGKFSQFLYTSVASTYQNNYIFINEDSVYDKGQTKVSGRFYLSNFHKSSVRDIFPQWGQMVDLNYSLYPFDREIYGSDLSLRTAIYFPGILRNNGIRLRYENESQVTKKFILGNLNRFPRGYSDILSEKLSFFSIDYVMPLLYPDFNISSLIYLKRIRTGIFYDHASGKGNYHLKSLNGSRVVDTYIKEKELFSSFGVELLSDLYLLRIPYLISGGVRSSWKEAGEIPVIEFLFNINIYGMSIGKRSL